MTGLQPTPDFEDLIIGLNNCSRSVNSVRTSLERDLIYTFRRDTRKKMHKKFKGVDLMFPKAGAKVELAWNT